MSLLKPALLAELSVYVRPDGTYHLTVSNTPPDPVIHEKIVRAALGAGADLARLYGLKLTWPKSA